MSKHSPGPWAFEFEEHASENYFIRDKDGKTIAWSEDWGNTPGAENARLIAAAPDMLKWLKAVERQLSYEVKAGSASESTGSGGMLDQIRALIHQAEGESS